MGACVCVGVYMLMVRKCESVCSCMCAYGVVCKSVLSVQVRACVCTFVFVHSIFLLALLVTALTFKFEKTYVHTQLNL